MNNKGLYTLGEIASVISGELLCGDGKAHINELLIDSRKASAGSDALFFAIRGERHDGHNYLRELSGKGIRSFIISDRDAIHLLERDANVICCKSSVQALQDLAAHHRTRFNVPVIAITGSNGKTVVKEWLFQLLSSVKTVIRSPKSYNSQVGVPLSVWKLNRNCDLGIFEAGISLPGEMERLQKIIQPGIGIFTNIGEAHSEGFGSMEEKVEEKMKLFSAVDALIYCSDHDLIHKAVPAGLHTFRWSARDRGADIFVERISRQDYGSRISIVCNGEAFEVDLPFSDRASLENALHCISACLCMGVDKEHLIHSLPAVEAVAMRLQMREGINRCTLINDTYNSDTGSLEVALDMLVRQNQHKKKTVVLSDILQTGKAENALYASVAQMLKTAGVHALIGVGRAICASKELFSLPEQRFYPATEELLADFGNLHFSDEAVLLKGARPFGFERIA
ncbi:MAG: UDP-N-acetylmuramoyl-tripeptide--D-alanyl-D-alanine ligase, partial [Flavobacteriales bacterium]